MTPLTKSEILRHIAYWKDSLGFAESSLEREYYQSQIIYWQQQLWAMVAEELAR